MKINTLLSSMIVVASLAVNAMAYDTSKAESLDKFYSNMTQKACADSKLFTPAEDIMKMFQEGKKFTLLDIRTAGEASIIALSAKNSKHIPIENLFEKANLDTLPTDEPIIVVCHSGTRATLATIGLKRLGFKNTHVLKGGLIALADANNPKNAPLK